MWRSLVARLFWVQEAAGSSPAAPTSETRQETRMAPRARIYRQPKTAMQSGEQVERYANRCPPEIRREILAQSAEQNAQMALA